MGNMSLEDLNHEAECVKNALIKNMNEMEGVRKQYSLASPDQTFETARQLLNKRNFDVVVCGEVKQGKTSFINALLGANLLPVEVKVATSQVFRIGNAAKESYFLVFDDGGRESISKEEMVAYGTESDERLAQDPLMRGRTLRWIEVNYPAAFLPEYIHILDTPGLGALYHSHAKITHKYVAEADAVIFIKSCKDPLVDGERDFLKKVFGITSNVLFVQSKIDMVGEEEREALAQRNETLLNQEFSKLAGRKFHAWPVSSSNLFQAAQESDIEWRELLKCSSGFGDLLKALESLFFRTAGYTGACTACTEAFRYYEQISGFALEQQKMLGASNAAERQKLQSAKAAALVRFNQSWGTNGTEIRRINEEINQIVLSGQQMVQGLFAPGGEIRKMFIAEIEALPDDLAAIKAFSQVLSERIQEKLCSGIQEIQRNTQLKLGETFEDFRMQTLTSVTAGVANINLSSVRVSESSAYGTVRNTFGGATMGMMIGGIGAAALLSAGIIATGGAGAFLIPLGTTIFGAIAGKKDADHTRAQADKRNLVNYVGTVMNEIQTALLFPKAAGEKSQIQVFFDALKKNVTDMCKSISEQQRNKLEEENAELERQSQLNHEESMRKLSELKRMQEQLSPIRVELLANRDKLTALNEQFNF